LAGLFDQVAGDKADLHGARYVPDKRMDIDQ
jgi:hypothetical protein